MKIFIGFFISSKALQILKLLFFCLSFVHFNEVAETNNSCLDDEFHCKNEKCIPKRYSCNGEKDCADGSDEHQSVCGIVFLII